jgi:hypothetical protein
MVTPDESLMVYRALVRRAFASDDLANLQIHFEIAVLDRYRGLTGYSLIRTETVGRLRKQGGWSLDFGIDQELPLIHISQADVAKLPREERDHWAAHAVNLHSSKVYLQMRMAPGSCIDDGDVRNWD